MISIIAQETYVADNQPVPGEGQDSGSFEQQGAVQQGAPHEQHEQPGMVPPLGQPQQGEQRGEGDGQEPDYRALYEQTAKEQQEMRQAWESMQQQAMQAQQLQSLQAAQQRWLQQQQELAQRANEAINQGFDPQQVIGQIQQYYAGEIENIRSMAQMVVQSQASQQYASRLAQEYQLSPEDHKMLQNYPPQQMANMAQYLSKINRDRQQLQQQIQQAQTRQTAQNMQRSGAHRIGGTNAQRSTQALPDDIKPGSRDHLAHLLGIRG